MPCRPFARKKKPTSKVLIAVFAALVCVLMLSEAAEAVRRNQIPVGVNEEEEEAPKEEKPKQVKIKIPAPKAEKAETIWHAPAAAPATTAPAEAPAADATAAPAAEPLAEDEVQPTPAPTEAVIAPVVDTANRLLQLTFEPGQVITAEQQRLELDTLVQKLKEAQTLRVTLNSFSSPREGQLNEARRVSLKRAMDVRNYLIGKGIAKDRINVRALGDMVADEPKDRLDITPL